VSALICPIIELVGTEGTKELPIFRPRPLATFNSSRGAKMSYKIVSRSLNISDLLYEVLKGPRQQEVRGNLFDINRWNYE
jgi:hypothetical protein